MKRLSVLLLTLPLLLGLIACGKKQAPGVTYPTEQPLPCSISRAELTPEQETTMQKTENAAHARAYTFRTESEADAIKLILYRLENGAWEDVAGGSWQELQGAEWDSRGAMEGTVLVQFENLWEDFSVAVQTGRSNTGTKFHPQGSAEGNSAVTMLSAVTDFEWEQTLPLAVQVVSLQDRVFPPDLDIWKHPEAYTNQGYEQVYLLALSLRQAPAEEETVQ